MNRTTCPDCGVAVGVAHTQGCDVARCLHDGGQRLAHELPRSTVARFVGAAVHDLTPPEHDCGKDVWTGEWPGDADAARLGFWCQWFNERTQMPEPNGTITGDPHTWKPCAPGAVHATEDLNRLNPAHARWDRTTSRWESLLFPRGSS